MNNNIFVRGLAALWLVLLAPAAVANEPPKPEATAPRTIRVLFFGSSLSDGLANAFKSVAEASQPGLSVDSVESLITGRGLGTHWGAGAGDRIKQEKWDYVVIQTGFDQMPGLRTVKLFQEATKQAGSTVVLFVTWGWRGSKGRQKDLDEAFLAIAKELDMVTAPIGPAWHRAQALDKGMSLWQMDSMHAAPMGTYVAACTVYSAIFGRPVPIDGATGPTAVARQAAWESVQEWRALLSQGTPSK
jgi:hypothetical protein